VSRRGAPAAALAALLSLLVPAPAAGQRYRYPFSPAHAGSTYVTAYFDHSGKDWNCGTKRYSGHNGNDFGVGSWSGMSAGREIVAAADGTVEFTHDGEFDRCTTGSCGGGGGYGNYVRLRHKDGKQTYYAHMKKGSVAVKAGQSVSCGQRLGQAGSSGNSTGPHLHFEVRSGSSRRDAFKGSCGGYGYWVSQGAYLGRPSLTCDGPTTPRLAARLAGQGSDALPPSGGAQFSLCPGQAVKLWFSLTNSGSLTWEDNNNSGVAGQAVRLGTRAADPLGAPSRVSLRGASDTVVKPGESTRFSIDGRAPSATGRVESRWQLTSEGVAWFGPALSMTFNVTGTPPGSKEACNTGKQGVCGPGTRRCSGGALRCVANAGPSPERCDGRDNNCDGRVDEGCPRPGGDAVAGGDLPPGLDGGPAGAFNTLSGGCGCEAAGRDTPAAGLALLALLVLACISHRLAVARCLARVSRRLRQRRRWQRPQ
jgi:murein DD-endopeptidase MepM/ murein hydrolase activator NlpD